MKSLLTTALALFVVAAPASAQDLVAANNSTVARVATDEPPRVPARLVRALNSMSADTRAEAMYQMLDIAYGSPRGVDLSPVADDLLSIFETETDPRHRVLALRCLQELGSERIMTALHESAHEETDPSVKRILYLVLLDHYGAHEMRQDPHAVDHFRAAQDGAI